MYLEQPSPWQVIYLYPNYEKKVYAALTKMKVEAYLPLYLVKRKWSDRVKILEKPLFPNYLFVRPNDREMYGLLNVPGIVRYVVFDGKGATLSHNEVMQIRSLIAMQHDLFRKTTASRENNDDTGLHSMLKDLKSSVEKRLNTTFLHAFLESLDMTVYNMENSNTILVSH